MLGAVASLVVLLTALVSSRTTAAVSCGTVLTHRHGLIQTPGFPGPLQVPIRCQWLIDSSGYAEKGSRIVVYLTQLFVTSGLRFTRYSSSDLTDPRPLLSISDENSVTTRWLSTTSRFLSVELELDRLEGNHLRVPDHLLHVFGFNITFEIVEASVRNDSCSVIDCSFAGDCFVDPTFQHFWCSCFDGFSGDRCNMGPICQLGLTVCLNGGVCRHAGKYPTCTCSEGYTGTRCEVPLNDPNCEDEGCLVRCRASGHQVPCGCRDEQPIQPDRWRYIMTLGLGNATLLMADHSWSQFNQYLEEQIQNLLRASSLSRLEDLKILNVSESGQLSFHFFGDLLDLDKVRLAQLYLSETRKIGEVSLSDLPVLLHHEQGLRVKEIQVNNWEVFENEQVIFSCVAGGSEEMEFNWFKDGHLIDPSKGLGEVWIHYLPKNSEEEYTAILGIDAAKVIDEGRYTCQVTDWGIQECKSYYLQVQGLPHVLVSPMSISVKKGDSVDITCVSTNQKVSYSWTRDKKLFPLNPSSEFWEDLKPWGSILRIKNIQKSVRYTCHAQAKSGMREKSVAIDLLAPGSCKEHEESGIIWKATSPGSVAMAECPSRYIGYCTRYCLPIRPGEADWEEPDYSKCISDFLDRIMADFQVISRGALKTNLWTLLSDLHSWLHSRPLYRGEGEPLVDFLADVTAFVNLTFTSEEVLNVTKIFYANVDLLLSHPHSFIHIEKVERVQRVIEQWSQVWARHLNATTASLRYDEMVIDIRKSIDGGSLKYYIPTINGYPPWYRANIVLKIRNRMNIAVINYRNISKFLPALSSQILSNGSELLYEIQSNLISILTNGNGKVELDLALLLNSQERNKWNITCARAEAIGSEWDTTSCLQVPLASDFCRCACDRPGLYALLFTSIISDKAGQQPRDSYPLLVPVACCCCFFQSCIALLLLSRRTTYLLLFEVQFSLAVSAIMAIFIYVTRVVPREDRYLLINIFLELFFFLALSSQLGKILTIYAQVFYHHNLNTSKRTVIGLTIGVTVLPCLMSATSEWFSATERQRCWWLAFGSPSLYAAATSALCIASLFVLLVLQLLRRIHCLKEVKDVKSSCILHLRLGLVKMTSVLFAMTMLVAISSVFFVNSPVSVNIYIFSFLSALLGLMILVCYLMESKPLLAEQFQNTATDLGHSSGSDYNLFNFLTEQKSEVENKDVPLEMRESGLEMKEILPSFLNEPK